MKATENNCQQRPIRVLHIVNKWVYGGVERFVEGLVAGCDSVRFEQSVLSICTGLDSRMDCPKYGPLHDGTSMTSMLLGAGRLRGFLLEHPCDVIHVHTQNSSGFLYCAIAKKAGVPCRVIHSHNSSLGEGSGLVKYAAQSYFRAACGGSETVRLACSELAGEHLFPGKGFRVVANGVDTARFAFDSAERDRIRTLCGAPDGVKVVGCVGSLIPVKNHLRAISVFSEYHKRVPLSKLVILGDGELRPSIEAAICEAGLSDFVSMSGFVDDPAPWYSAMDALLFPSLFEGLPIALVEAQCSGLPVVASDAVTREVALAGDVQFLSLDAPDSQWAAALEGCVRDFSGSSAERVREAGFDQSDLFRSMEGIWEKGTR